MGQLTGQRVQLVASAARTTNGDSGWLSLPFDVDDVMFVCRVTAIGGTPTLDLYVQSSDDGGTTPYDVLHFTQISTTGVKLARWSAHVPGNADGADIASGDAVLTAGKVVNGPIDRKTLRVKWVIAGTTPSLTFLVNAVLGRQS